MCRGVVGGWVRDWGGGREIRGGELWENVNDLINVLKISLLTLFINALCSKCLLKYKQTRLK